MYSVYLVAAEINNKKLYKIGYTRRSVEKRVKEFKTGNASEFQIIGSFKSEWGTIIESQLHKKYNKFKISGEWFDLSENEVNSFLSSCQSIHDSFKLMNEINTYVLDRNGKF